MVFRETVKWRRGVEEQALHVLRAVYNGELIKKNRKGAIKGRIDSFYPERGLKSRVFAKIEPVLKFCAQKMTSFKASQEN